jgi:hypothetical protein
LNIEALKILDSLDFKYLTNKIINDLELNNADRHTVKLFSAHAICKMQIENIFQFNPLYILPNLSEALEYYMDENDKSIEDRTSKIHFPNRAADLMVELAQNPDSGLSIKAQVALQDPVKLAKVLVQVFTQRLNPQDETPRVLTAADLEPVFKHLGIE